MLSIAIYRVNQVVEYLEDAASAGRFKSCFYSRRHNRQLHISIPFHRFFEAAEQEVNCRRIQFAELATIEDQPRAVFADASLQQAVECLSLLCVQLHGQVSNRYGSLRINHSQ